MDNMENNQGQQPENSNYQQGDQGQQKNEKLFTQDEVNRIVGERLARVKNNSSGVNDFDRREQELNRREMQIEAREKLAEAGLPKDLLDAVNCNSKEEMEKSIKALTGFFGARKAQSGYRVYTGIAPGGNGGTGMNESDIRKAMGLKGR